MDFPDSLVRAEGTRYFFWQLYDFPGWMKCLPLLRAYEQTFPWRKVPLFSKSYWDSVLASSQSSEELAGDTTWEATLSSGRLQRDMEEWMKHMSDSVPEEELTLFYFSPKYLNICYARGRKKEHAQVRVVQLGPAPVAVHLHWGILVTGRCLLHPHFVESKLMFSIFQVGQTRPAPWAEILWGVHRNRTAGALGVLTEFKCFQWQMKKEWWFWGVKFEQMHSNPTVYSGV